MVAGTLSVAAIASLVAALVGLLLLHAWRQNGIPALGWWGASNLLVAIGTGVPLISPELAESPLATVGNAAVLLGFGMFWAGVRSFEGRPVRLAWATFGAVFWITFAAIPPIDSNVAIRTACLLTIVAAYITSSAFEVIRHRGDRLASRNAATLILCSYAITLAGRIPVTLMSGTFKGTDVFSSEALSVFALEHLLFTVAMAFVLLAMVKERLEAHQKKLAATDALTGVANRRSFFEHGGKVLAESQGGSAAVILFDLDRFKDVNDTFGHKAGDEVLVAFTRTVAPELRARDIFARLGGEEFACLLPGLAQEEAAGVAERVRSAFENGTVMIDGLTIRVTVSAGVSSSDGNKATLDMLLAEADKALYAAKRLGRNRVELSVGQEGDGDAIAGATRNPGSVVRGFRGRQVA